MPATEFDLGAYFDRIGYTGQSAPTLETLQRVHALHTEHIAFENLSLWMGEPVKLDIASLQDKLVARRRGGYCFEQNLLLARVLGELGFTVRGLAARVRWNVPEGVMTARGHMLLLVDLPDGSHIADVGFGGMTLTAPLRLAPDIEQATPHEPFRLRAGPSAGPLPSRPASPRGTVRRTRRTRGRHEAGDTYTLEAKVGGEWKALYAFDLREQHPIDYEVTSWYLSNHPQSHFVTGLIAARPEPGRRHALRNNSYSVHEANGPTRTLVLTSAGELKDLLASAFGIRLPEGAALESKLRSLVAR